KAGMPAQGGSKPLQRSTPSFGGAMVRGIVFFFMLAACAIAFAFLVLMFTVPGSGESAYKSAFDTLLLGLKVLLGTYAAVFFAAALFGAPNKGMRWGTGLGFLAMVVVWGVALVLAQRA